MLNVIAVMGRLTADPELRKIPNGTSTTTITIACDRNFAKANGERETDFFDIVAWRGTAEFICKYFRKGQLIAVDGSLQTRFYEDKEGKRRKVFEIMASNVSFADSKPTGTSSKTYSNEPEPTGKQEYSSDSPNDFAIIDDSEDLPF